MFEKDVRTPSGHVKHVVASSEAELKAAITAVQEEPERVTPNIDNPDHGNVIVEKFVSGEETPDEQRVEANPTSEESKRVSKELADVPRSERAEVLEGFEAEADNREIVELPKSKGSQDDAQAKDKKSAAKSKEEVDSSKVSK